jgi:hypothetical protein
MKGEINGLETISEERLNDFVLRSAKDWRFTVLLKLHGYEKVKDGNFLKNTLES